MDREDLQRLLAIRVKESRQAGEVPLELAHAGLQVER